MNRILVENIRAVCRAQNTSITKLEKSLGFGNGTIGKWANAPKSPPYEKLALISRALGIPVDALYDENLDPNMKTNIFRFAHPEFKASEFVIREENEKSPTGQEADEAKSIDYLLSKMTPAELAELMGKVAQELKERGLE